MNNHFRTSVICATISKYELVEFIGKTREEVREHLITELVGSWKYRRAVSPPEFPALSSETVSFYLQLASFPSEFQNLSAL